MISGSSFISFEMKKYIFLIIYIKFYKFNSIKMNFLPPLNMVLSTAIQKQEGNKPPHETTSFLAKTKGRATLSNTHIMRS
jgi:hypothetical protein